jgi:hypothetical protein
MPDGLGFHRREQRRVQHQSHHRMPVYDQRALHIAEVRRKLDRRRHRRSLLSFRARPWR